uniref:Uncharacterized protein n=1 Tax=Oryza rufipogon TaxID=4529 RepID=A0A0G2KBR7_ORYRU
MDWEQVVP